jgi:UDP-glucuronate 4-epimerase
VRRLVFASSSSVYGARGAAAAFREDDPCLTPASPYAASKRAGELLCSTYRDLFGIGVSCLRFFTVYGPRQRGDMAIHRFTSAIAHGRPVTLFDADSARDYTYIDDIIDGTAAATLAVAPGAYNLYNLGGTHVTGLVELVELIGAALGTAPQVTRGAPQPGDVPITWADVSRAAADLGYAPKVPVREGIARYVAWARAEGIA